MTGAKEGLKVGDEADRWRLQRGLGATVLPVALHHKIFPIFFFFFGVSCHCGLNPVCIRRIEVFWEEDDRGRQSCDRFVLSL